MIRINRLVVRVPSSMRPQAAVAVRQAVNQLARTRPARSRSVARLNAGRVRVPPGTPPSRMAARLGENLQRRIQSL